MSEHERLADQAAADADHLEDRNERLEEGIEEAREARDRAASDDFIATEAPGQSSGRSDQPIGDLTDIGDSQDDDGPPPEITYTSKE